MPAAECALASMFVVLAAVGGIFSSVLAALAPAPEGAAAVASILEDDRLRLMCLAGSLGGGVLSVGLFKLAHARDMAVKFVCSSTAGFIFAPMILRWMGWGRDMDSVLAVSGATALLSWTVLQKLVPAITKVATKRLEDQTQTREMKP